MAMIVVIVVGVGCRPPGPRNADELERAYKAVWSAIPRDGDVLGRELFQLAFPTSTSVSVWHLYEKDAAFRTPIDRFGVRRKDLPGQTIFVRMSRRDVQGIVYDETPLPTQAPRTERIDFQGLEPNTEYEILVDDVVVLQAKTKPRSDETPNTLSFLAFSCNNPYAVTADWVNGKKVEPFDAEWRKRLSWGQNSLRLFAARSNGVMKIHDYERPAFALGLGDQVYVDGDNEHGNQVAIFHGDRSEPTFTYYQPFDRMLDVVYRAHFAMPHFDRALQGVPAALIWDDHELQDGWGTEANELRHEYRGRYFKAALNAFLGYQSLRNPAPHKMHAEGQQTMDVEFDWGKSLRVMLLDTRSSDLPAPGKRVNKQKCDYPLWNEQLAKVSKWLSAVDAHEPMLFVLGLSSPLTIASNDSLFQDWLMKIAKKLPLGEAGDDLEDLWVTKETAREELLRTLAGHFLRHRRHRLLILSGDVHFSGINYLSTGAGSPWHGNSDIVAHFQSKVCPAPENVATMDVPEKKAAWEQLGASGEHVLWGWEVITSGITNDVFPDDGKQELLTYGTIRDEQNRPLLTSWPRGTIYGSPSFSEILVQKADGKFDVRVIFYPSVARANRQDAGRLINPANMFERTGGQWMTEDYRSFVGSVGSCAHACPTKNTLTTVRLEWDCIPPAHREEQVFNCVHACSDVRSKRGNAQESRLTSP